MSSLQILNKIYKNMKIRIITTFICLLCYVGLCKSENYLQLSHVSGHPTDTVELSLSMNNSDDVVALQAMIPLHGQLLYLPNSCAMSSRGSTHYVSASVLNDTYKYYKCWKIKRKLFKRCCFGIFKKII